MSEYIEQSPAKFMQRKRFNNWLVGLQKEMQPLTDERLIQYVSDIEFFRHYQVKEKLKEIPLYVRNKSVDKLRNAAGEAFVTINEVFGDRNISPLFRRVAEHEGSLFALLPFYRDHIAHSVRVFLTGVYVLKILNQKLPQLYTQCFRSKELDYTTFLKWLLTSTCHDIAIPVEKFKEINDVLKEFYGRFPGFDFEKAKLNPLQSWIVSLPEFLGNVARNPKTHAKLLKNLDEKEHGVLGAITLLYLSIQGMTELQEMPTDYYDLYIMQYIVPVARAIALHNEKELTVRFEDEPFSFLLILCDEIQEWGRYIAAGRIFAPFESIYETWMNVREEENNLRIDVLHLSSGKDHVTINEFNPKYVPSRLIEEKEKNLIRLRSERIGGYFFIARTAAREKDVHPELRKYTTNCIAYGNKFTGSYSLKTSF